MIARKTKTPLESAVLWLVLCPEVGSTVIPTAPTELTTVVKTRRTVRGESGGVKSQMGLEDGERILEVGLQVLEIFDSHRNSYETIG